MARLFILSMFTFILATACNSPQKDAPEENEEQYDKDMPEETTPEESESINIANNFDQFITVVEHLRMREKPDLKAKVVMTLQQSTVLTSLHEESNFKQKIKLRGVEHDKPWYKVKTPKGETGWVYGGAVKGVEPIKQQKQIDEFISWMESLPKSDPNSIGRAVLKLKRQFLRADQASVDVAVLQFRTVYLQNIQRLDPKLDEELIADLNDAMSIQEPYESLDMSMTDYTQDLKLNGVTYDSEEGNYYLDADPEYLLEKFGSMVSAPLKTFLKQIKKEGYEGFSKDAGLIITPVNVAERLLFWEKFNLKNPIFYNSKEVKGKICINSNTLVYGMANTPIFDFSTKKVDVSFQKAFDYLRETKTSYSEIKQLNSYYKALEDNNLTAPETISEIQSKYSSSCRKFFN